MLSKHLLGASVSLSLAAAACGGTKATGSTGAMGGSGTTTSSGTTGTTSSGTTSSGSAACGGLFQAAEPWNTPCDQDPVDPASSTIIGWLAGAGGWGNGNVLQIDTSINIQCADASTPMKPFTLSMGSCSPDCDNATTFPVPPGGAVEGETGYACNGGGDCHLLVVDHADDKLYEMYQAFDPPDPNVFNSGGGAIIWDLTKAYPPNLRGDGCTSADAGGFPIAAMLFTADEVAAGHIDHAIRFILPNARIRDGASYVHPATHTGVDVSSLTRPNAPPYGVHFRLKPTFDLTKLPSDGARTVAKALQKYGMFLSDGGNIALTAADDRFTTAKWADANVNVDPKALSSIKVTDFDVVNLGTIITTGDNCIRNP
jgi:serine/threonine-protein kinase